MMNSECFNCEHEAESWDSEACKACPVSKGKGGRIMIIHDQMVEVIRNALVDYESATGLECQIRYADRLSAVVEVVLELAEEVPESVARTPIVSRMPAVEVVPLADTSEPQTENQMQTKASELNLHQRIIEMRSEGMKVAEIADKLDTSMSTVYNHIKFEREQEAK